MMSYVVQLGLAHAACIIAHVASAGGIKNGRYLALSLLKLMNDDTSWRRSSSAARWAGPNDALCQMRNNE